MASARTRLGVDLTDELGAQGITAEIHVREDVKATIPWPPTEVLALLPAADFVEAARAMETQAQPISDALPDLIRLTVIPVVDGHAVPELGRAGHGSLLPLPDVANDWMENIEIPAFHSTVSASFDRACALASARQSMDRLERGREGRPTQEREALDQVQLAYSEERITVEQAVEVLGSALVAEALNVLDRIRNGTLLFADEIHNLLNGGTIAALREVAAVRLLLAQAELDVEIGNHAGDA